MFVNLITLFFGDGALRWLGASVRAGRVFVVLRQQSLRRGIGTGRVHFGPGGLGCCPLWGGGSGVVDLLFCVPPVVCGGSVFVFVLLCIMLCSVSGLRSSCR